MSRLILFPLLLGVLSISAAETPTREQIKAELREAAKELERESRAVNLIHELVAPSVVSIHTSEKFRYRTFSGRAFTREVEVGEGSGFIFHSDKEFSYILTNAHVVVQTNTDQQFVVGRNGQPIGFDGIRIIMTDSREVAAEYVGVYVESDLAVLRIPLGNQPVLEFANSDLAKVGDFVVALGYPLGVGYSATSGIISATDRSTGIYSAVGGFDSFIQTDAAINPGNSGGPLIDRNGQVIGVNASIISKTGVNIGLGFAIPANLASRVANDLRQFGRVRRPAIGIQLDNLQPDKAKALGLPPMQAVKIMGVVPESPAASAGLKEGDVIMGINDSSIRSLQQFQSRVASAQLGQELTLGIWRGGQQINVAVTPVAEEDLKAKILELARDTATKRGVPVDGYGIWLAGDDRMGLRISAIENDSVAQRAGLKVGDRLMYETSIGRLSSTDDARELSGRPQLVVQVFQDGRSFWMRLRRK